MTTPFFVHTPFGPRRHGQEPVPPNRPDGDAVDAGATRSPETLRGISRSWSAVRMSSSSTQRCVLVRHGETEWSRDGRHTSRTDLPLLPEGEAQAEALRPLLEPFRFAAVLTSPLARARETCRLAGLCGDRGGTDALDGVFVDPDLGEWDYGSYEGATTAAIHEHRPGWDLFEEGAPGGEDADAVGRRVDRVIERVRQTGGDVACVAHAHVLRVLAVRWIGLEPAMGRSFVLGPASLSVLGSEHEAPAFHAWNVAPPETPAP